MTAILAVLAFGLVGSLELSGATVAADGPLGNYFEQLRQRRLFSLAEVYCYGRLEEERLAPALRTEIVLQLSQTLAEHAAYSSSEEQDELWQQAVRVIEDELEKHPQRPRRLVLEIQKAFVRSDRADFHRWHVELRTFDEQSKRAALSLLDEVFPVLTEMEKKLAGQAFQTSYRQENDTPGPKESRGLHRQVRFRLGEACLNRGRLYPANSSERINALSEAERWLRPLTEAETVKDGSLRSKSRLLMVRSARLRGNLQRASHMLDAVEQSPDSVDILDWVIAERARILLAQNRPDQAASLFLDFREIRNPIPGELQFLDVKSLIEVWKLAQEKNNPALARELLVQIEAHVERAEREIGGYWADRCRQLLQTAREMKVYGRELAQLLRRARTAYAAGQIDEAIEAYAEAAASAHQAGNSELAFELGYTRASTQLRAERYDDAREAFHELVERFSSDKRAAEAHILWAYSLGKLYDQHHSRSNREAYTQALIQHRERFPDGPTAAEATWMLALLKERRQQTSQALQLYDEIPPEHRRGLDAQAAIARCYDHILERLRELQKSEQEWEEAAIEHLSQFAASFPPKPQHLKHQHAEVALRLAKLYLNSRQPDYRGADQLLDRILETGKRTDGQNGQQPASVRDRWEVISQAATQLRILSLAGQGRTQEAKFLLKEVSAGRPNDVLSVLKGLADLITGPVGQWRREVGELQLQAAENLHRRRDELTPAQARLLDDCRAEAYLATNQPQKAVEVYTALLRGSPTNKELLETLAQIQMETGRRQHLEQSRVNWRKLESLENDGSVAWLTARYHVAWCSLQLDDRENCRKLVAITRLLYPQLGTEELRAKFEALEEQLK